MKGYLTALLITPLLLRPVADASESPMEIHFETDSDEPRWVAVNDTVMGGVSRGGPEIDKGILTFRGVLSLENNGGFSSIRSRGVAVDLTGAKGVALRVRGDGRTYQLRIATDALYRGSRISYAAEFPTTKGEWMEVRVPFSDLRPGWRGRRLDGPPFDPAKIEEFGILLGDKKEGPFLLEVDWLKAVPAT